MRTAKTDQADLSVRWADRSVCWFCHVAATMELTGWVQTNK